MMKAKAASLVVLILISSEFSGAQSSTCAISWNAPIRVSSDAVVSISSRLSISGDTVHLLWFGLDPLGTAEPNSGIQYSHSFDGGSTFSSQLTLSPGDTAFSLGFISSSGPFVFVTFAAAIDIFSGVVDVVFMRSTDGGLTWGTPQRLQRNAIPRLIEATPAGLLIHYLNQQTNRNGMYRSLDNGVTWTRITIDIPEFSSIVYLNDRLHALSSFGSPHKDVYYYSSQSGGAGWSYPELLSGEDFTSSDLPKLATNGRKEMFAVWNDDGTFVARRSRTYGGSWLPQVTLFTGRGPIFSDVAAGAEFVTTVWDQDAAVAISLRPSNDYGASYCPIDSPTTSTQVGEPVVKIFGNSIHLAWSETVVGNTEILYRHGTLTDNPNLVERPPQEFALKQNYPNPFNGTTHIQFDLPNPTNVQLTVYNTLCQRVATLVNGPMPAGRPDVIFDVTNLPSGLYFYQLRTDQFVETRKMLIVR